MFSTENLKRAGEKVHSGQLFETEGCLRGQLCSSNKENTRIMECFAKIKELDRKIHQNEVILWENTARLRGELDTLWYDTSSMIEDDASEDSNTVMVSHITSDVLGDLENNLPFLDQKSNIQHNFLMRPYHSTIKRNQEEEDILSTIESVGSLADEVSATVNSDDLCDDKETSAEWSQIDSNSMGSTAHKASKNSPGQRQSYLSEVEEEKMEVLLKDTSLNKSPDNKEISTKLLQIDCYGGNEHAEELHDLDRKLIEQGYCNDYGETSRVFYQSDGLSEPHQRDKVLVELADQRFLREKQRCINDALVQLESFPLSIADYNYCSTRQSGKVVHEESCGFVNIASFSSIYKPLTQSDIRLMVADAEVELNGKSLLCREDISRLVKEILNSFVYSPKPSSNHSQ